MRDPKRINRILIIIEKIWEKQPDTRFNQLIDNLQHEYINETGETGWKVNRQIVESYGSKVYLHEESYIDMFHLEDDKFEDFLINKLNKR